MNGEVYRKRYISPRTYIYAVKKMNESYFECICCFETHKISEPYFTLTSKGLEEGYVSFLICEACGRKIIKTKMAKLKG